MDGIIVIALIAFAIWLLWGRRQLQIGRATGALQSIPGYTAAYSVVGTDGASLALDPAAKKVAFVDRAGKPVVYDFKDIVAVEVCKNGISVTKTNRGSQVITALVGQLIFGHKGFIIGGNTGSQRTSERVMALSMKVYLTDHASPVREIGFYKGSAIETNSRKFKRCATELDEWYGRMQTAIANP